MTPDPIAEVGRHLKPPRGTIGRRSSCPKLQLKERLSRSQALSECIVGIEITDKLTDPEDGAKVKEKSQPHHHPTELHPLRGSVRPCAQLLWVHCRSYSR
jgi:hypothetical protein